MKKNAESKGLATPRGAQSPIIEYSHIFRYTSILMKDTRQPPVEELHPKDPVALSLKGVPILPGLHRGEAGSVLEIKFSEAANQSTRAYVLKTPMKEYIPGYEAIAQKDGGEVDIGDIPSMVFDGSDTFTAPLEEDSLLDVFVVHNDQITPTRVSTTEEPATSMTFDEVKLLLAIRTGLSPKDLSGVSATVIADKVHMRNRNELAYFGLRIDHLIATISQQQLFGMFFVDRNDFWKEPTRKEFREHLLQNKIRTPVPTPNEKN